MPLVEAFLALLFLYQYQCLYEQVGNHLPVLIVCHLIFVFKFYLLHRRKCTLTHVRVSKHQVHF